MSSTSDSVRTVRRVGAEALMSPEMGRGRPTWQIARRPVDGDGPVPVVDDVTTLGGTMSNPWSPPQPSPPPQPCLLYTSDAADE